MTLNVTNRITITVPVSKLSACTNEAMELTRICGGVTKVKGDGGWFDETNRFHAEEVRIATWHFPDSKADMADRAARALVDALFASGELAVMKTRFYTPHTARVLGSRHYGEVSRIIYAPEEHQRQIKLTLPDVLADDQSLRHLNS
ncbi:hypothetical protein [Stenotrophomonas phage TS-10]|uniref:Uncharacterized protein n=1 Tax=Stenotrophomonas phage TS-10 TaxID=2886106 RepID=A0AAE8Y8W8_9CAUD|nr:hypothetical protein [Stenotrophomonas phage TS-10]